MAIKKESPVKKTAIQKSAVKKKSAAKKTVIKKTVPAKKKSIIKKATAKSDRVLVEKVVKNKKSSSKSSKPAVKTISKKVAKPADKKVKDKIQLLADAAVDGILELKGRNITIMNLQKINNRVCDYYIICQADSNTQVNAIAGSVEEIVKKKTGEKPYRSEGFQNSEWILVDYVTVVVHIFQSHIRSFYNLESLWADAEITELAFD